MPLKRQPKTVLAVLVGGTLLLVGGTALAVSLPAPAHMMNMMAMGGTPSSSAGSTSSAAATSSAASTSSAAPAPNALPTASAMPGVTSSSSSRSRTATAKPAPTVKISISPAATKPAATKPAINQPAAKKAATGTTMTVKTQHAGNAKKRPDLTYVVKKGDTLFGIAKWFKFHGYGDLYQANVKVIGSDPSLIHPGERITISSSKWSVKAPK